jgi:hypothetical protein
MPSLYSVCLAGEPAQVVDYNAPNLLRVFLTICEHFLELGFIRRFS